jgi:branched-chain amino acid transport system permease protein
MLYSLIGGTGTLIGAIVGSAVVIYFQNILLNLRAVHPIFERWLLFFGTLYIVVIIFMPEGIVGYINRLIERHRQRALRKAN